MTVVTDLPGTAYFHGRFQSQQPKTDWSKRNLKSVDGFTDSVSCILAQRVTTRRDPTPPPGGPADHSLDFAKTKDYTKFVFIISLLKLSQSKHPESKAAWSVP